MTDSVTGLGRAWCALVPMRHESERVPGKNYRQLQGRPLFSYVVDTLLSVGEVELIVIDTDSPVIKEICASRYPQVVVIDRTQKLRGGTVPMTDVIAYDATVLGWEWYLQTHSTNPFLTGASIRRAIRRLESSPTADSLFSVSRLQARLFDSQGRPLNHDPKLLLRTQDLEPVFIENSNLYLFSKDLALNGWRIGATPIMFELSADEALDIDTEADWVMAELYAKTRARV